MSDKKQKVCSGCKEEGFNLFKGLLYCILKMYSTDLSIRGIKTGGPVRSSSVWYVLLMMLGTSREESVAFIGP